MGHTYSTYVGNQTEKEIWAKTMNEEHYAKHIEHKSEGSAKANATVAGDGGGMEASYGQSDVVDQEWLKLQSGYFLVGPCRAVEINVDDGKPYYAFIHDGKRMLTDGMRLNKGNSILIDPQGYPRVVENSLVSVDTENNALIDGKPVCLKL